MGLAIFILVAGLEIAHSCSRDMLACQRLAHTKWHRLLRFLSTNHAPIRLGMTEAPARRRVHFYYPAAAEKHLDEFPLVVFSHDAFGYYQSNTSTYRELASNGYAVVALDHLHHAFFTTNINGQPVLVDQGFLDTALEVSSQDTVDASTQ